MVTPYKTQPKKKKDLLESPLSSSNSLNEVTPPPKPSTPETLTPTPKNDSVTPTATPKTQPTNTFIRDQNTGQITGYIKPNGESVFGITQKEAQFLAKKYNPDTMGLGFADTPKLTQEQQIQAEIDRSVMKQEMINAQTPQNLTPEQASNIGTFNQDIINNPDALDASIQQNINYRNNPLDIPIGDKGLLGLSVPYTNKVTGLINQIPYVGTSLINALSQDRKTREYLQDYSNKDNLDSIRKDIGTANKQIADMITNAKVTANTPEQVKAIKEIYNNAQSVKFKKIAQLKLIADNDQRAYTDTIKDDLTELYKYFDEGGKFADDTELFAALNKPNPKYLNYGR